MRLLLGHWVSGQVERKKEGEVWVRIGRESHG